MTSMGLPATTGARPVHRQESTNLADILERVLDKGIVIAGDIRINLLDIELLTVKIRLLIASVDKAREMGIDWWEHDPSLSSGQRDLAEENRMLRQRIGALQSARLTGHNAPGPVELDRAGEPEPPGRESERNG
jgi:gas vesicle protein GvpA/GvpJ/GvpM family